MTAHDALRGAAAGGRGPGGPLLAIMTLGAGLAAVLAPGRSAVPADLAAAAAWVAERHPGVRREAGADVAARVAAGWLLLDVRSAAEWEVGHLPGAVRCTDPAAALAAVAERGAPGVIVYCSIGERSSRLAARLRILAPQLEARDLAGGIFAWAAEARPMVDGAGRPTSLVHPHDAAWGRLLPARVAAPLP